MEELRKALETAGLSRGSAGEGSPTAGRRPRSHLADDLAVLGQEDLHGGPLGGSPEHTHGGGLGGQGDGALSSPATARSSRTRAGRGPGPATRRLPPGGRLSPREHPASTSHSRPLGRDGRLDRPFPLLALLATLPVWQVGTGGAWATDGSKLAHGKGEARGLEGEAQDGGRVLPGRRHLRPAGRWVGEGHAAGPAGGWAANR